MKTIRFRCERCKRRLTRKTACEVAASFASSAGGNFELGSGGTIDHAWVLCPGCCRTIVTRLRGFTGQGGKCR